MVIASEPEVAEADCLEEVVALITSQRGQTEKQNEDPAVTVAGRLAFRNAQLVLRSSKCSKKISPIALHHQAENRWVHTFVFMTPPSQC